MSADEHKPVEVPQPMAAPVPTPISVTRPSGKPAPAFQRREVWLSLPAPYDGWRMNVWINHPAHLGDEAESYDEAVRIGALGKVFLEHNSWPDPMHPGEILPPTTTKEFWERAPDEAVGIVLAMLKAEKDEVPNSIRRRRGNLSPS